MTRAFVFAVPGDLATPTGGYAYDRRIIAELVPLGWRAEILDLGHEFPCPGPACRAAARAALASVPNGRAIVIDGLALGALPEVAALGSSHKLIALVHHPLALETGLSPETRDAFRRSERAALAAVRQVIVTGGITARLLVSDYAVPTDRISVALPGVDPVLPAPARNSALPALLAVGALVPRKGYDVLLSALAQIADLPWRLTIAGACDRSPATAAEVAALIAAHKLEERVVLAGAVPAGRLAELYAEADVFVLASRFEGYGMAYAEAIAHGVPVIGTTAGAIPETVSAGAGILVAPDDSGALATALRRVIQDHDERRRLAAGARAAAARLPRWAQAAEIFARVLASME